MAGSGVWALSVRPKPVAMTLWLVVVGLVGISVILNIGKVAGIGIPAWLVDLFRLNQEENVPSFFSGLLLALSALLSYLVYAKERAAQRPRAAVWLFLAPLFLFLDYDELFSVHELLIDVVRDNFDVPGYLQFAWEPVYAVFVVVIAFIFWPLWRAQPRQIRWILAIAAISYLGGALGFETLGGIVYTGAEGDIVYGLLYTAEESLEMIGVVILIYGLLVLLSGAAVQFENDTDSKALAEPDSVEPA